MEKQRGVDHLDLYFTITGNVNCLSFSNQGLISEKSTGLLLCLHLQNILYLDSTMYQTFAWHGTPTSQKHMYNIILILEQLCGTLQNVVG